MVPPPFRTSPATGSCSERPRSGGSTGTRSTTPRRDGRSTTLARSGLPPPSPSEHCAAVSTATLPIHARCPYSLAASHTHVWACSLSCSGATSRPPASRSTARLRSTDGIHRAGRLGEGGRDAAIGGPLGNQGRAQHVVAAAWIARTAVARIAAQFASACAPVALSPRVQDVRNRISVLCVLVVAMLSRSI